MRHEAEVLLEAMLSSHTTKANEDHVPQPGREFLYFGEASVPNCS